MTEKKSSSEPIKTEIKTEGISNSEASNMTNTVPTKTPVDAEISRLQNKVGKTPDATNESGSNGESGDKKLKTRERIRIYAEEKLQSLKSKMPPGVFERHRGEVDKLLKQFSEDVTSIEAKVKKELAEMEKETRENDNLVKDLLNSLQNSTKTTEIKPIFSKIESLTAIGLQKFEKALKGDPVKRAIFLSSVRDCRRSGTLKTGSSEEDKNQKNLQELFGSLATTKDDAGNEISVGGSHKQDMVDSFKKELERKQFGVDLTKQVDHLRSNIGPKIKSLQSSIQSGNIESFFKTHASIKGELLSSIKEYNLIIEEGSKQGNKDIVDTAKVARSALEELANLNSENYLGLINELKRFDGDRKKRTLSELSIRCDAAIAGLAGNIAFVSFENKENKLQTSALLEATLKNDGIEKVSSNAFAEYLIHLSNSGKLSFAYLHQAIGMDALKKFGYLWGVGDKNKKVGTNAQNFLEKNKKEEVKNQFQGILKEVFDKEDAKYKLEKASNYTNTKKILIEDGKFSESKSKEIIEMLQNSATIDPLKDLVTILATSKIIESRDTAADSIDSFLKKVADGIHKDNDSLVAGKVQSVGKEIELTLPLNSKWNKIKGFIADEKNNNGGEIKWSDLMREAKTPDADAIKTEKTDDWLFNSPYTISELFESKENIIAAKKIIEKYKGKNVFKPSYEKILSDYIDILIKQNYGKTTREIIESRAQRNEVTKAAKTVNTTAKKDGKEKNIQEISTLAEKTIKEDKVDEKIQKINEGEKIQKIINESPSVQNSGGNGLQNGSHTTSGNGERESIVYTPGLNSRSYLESGTSISFGTTEISKSESGELIIDNGDRTTTIDKKYANAALVTIEVANKIGFPELVQNIDFFISEMKHDPLFERILDGASEYEEVLITKRLANTLGLKFDNSANTPSQLYNSIENNRTLLPGTPSVQYIALQNGIIGNNGRIRRETFISRLKNPLLSPAV